MELWLFLGLVLVLLIALAWRNGAFGQRRYDDKSGKDAFSHVAPTIAALNVRDFRSQMGPGDRLGGRGPGDGRGD
jgi:hypothetical protein